MALNIFHRFSIMFYIFLVINKTLCFVHQMHPPCEEIPEKTLAEILGPAYNSRYMSINKPPDHDDVQLQSKRNVLGVNDYYVTDDYLAKLTNQPAWEVINHVKLKPEDSTLLYKRGKRHVMKISGEWNCKSKAVWEDLGPDYFPRYILNVKCISKNCWFTRFSCVSRSFTVKILMKEHGQCAEVGPETIKSLGGTEKTLRQVWVWVETAIHFCCDCAI